MRGLAVLPLLLGAAAALHRAWPPACLPARRCYLLLRTRRGPHTATPCRAACQRWDASRGEIENGIFLGRFAALTFKGPYRLEGKVRRGGCGAVGVQHPWPTPAAERWQAWELGSGLLLLALDAHLETRLLQSIASHTPLPPTAGAGL